MARIRSLKPEFFMSDSTGAVSFGARLLFAGLWTLVDREGRWIWRPKMVKAHIFPHDRDEVVSVEEWATELVRADMVRFYQDDEAVYVWLPAFLKHQRPHPKEPASVLPAWSAAHPKGWLPWKNTASRETPGTIPSSPGGREGKGTDPDPCTADAGRARITAPGPLAGTLPRDHLTHGFCGSRFCVPSKTVADLERRYGAGGAVAVQAWLQSLNDGLRDDESAGGPLWVVQHFDRFLAASGRLQVATPAAVSPVEAFKARQRAKASGGVA